jgi:hypothetical protein
VSLEGHTSRLKNCSQMRYPDDPIELDSSLFDPMSILKPGHYYIIKEASIKRDHTIIRPILKRDLNKTLERSDIDAYIWYDSCFPSLDTQNGFYTIENSHYAVQSGEALSRAQIDNYG